MPFPLNVWLVHRDGQACDAFRHRFAALPDVSIRQSTFEEMEPHDAFVTAGNSFGIMTAGFSPPHRLDWETVISREKAISYDGDRQVIRR